MGGCGFGDHNNAFRSTQFPHQRKLRYTLHHVCCAGENTGLVYILHIILLCMGLVLSMGERNERTWVARFILMLLDLPVNKVTDNDEQSDYYPDSNNPDGWPKRAVTTCTGDKTYKSNFK